MGQTHFQLGAVAFLETFLVAFLVGAFLMANSPHSPKGLLGWLLRRGCPLLVAHPRGCLRVMEALRPHSRLDGSPLVGQLGQVRQRVQ